MEEQTDYIVRAMTSDGLVRVFAACSTQTVETARRRHQTAPTATAALGRVLTATGLMGSMLEPKQRVTVRVVGSGPLGFIVADAQGDATVRGYVQQTRVDLPVKAKNKLDVGSAVGLPGWIHVARDLGLREAYTGTAPLVSGEIAEDFTNYFAVSEQTPSLVALGVLVQKDLSVAGAGGLFAQLMPGADQQLADKLEANAAPLQSISRLIEQQWTPEALIQEMLTGLDYQILARSPLRFHCDCHYERILSVLAVLGQEELQSMVDTKEAAELSCHFCGDRYEVPVADIQKLLAEQTRQ